MEPKQAAKRPLAIRSRVPPQTQSINAKSQPETAEPHSTSFDFFDLPRELRDEIYEDCLIYKQKFAAQHGARLRGRKIINSDLLRVSKQFRREYTLRAEHHTCLVIVDRPEFHGDLITLPPAINYVRKLELHLAIACDAPDHLGETCRVQKEMRMHRKWVKALCGKMRFLESLTIKLVIDPHEHIKTCEQSLVEHLWMFEGVEELKVLEVWHCDYAGREIGWNFAKSRVLSMQYLPEERELRRLEIPKAASDSSTKVDEAAA